MSSVPNPDYHRGEVAENIQVVKDNLFFCMFNVLCGFLVCFFKSIFTASCSFIDTILLEVITETIHFSATSGGQFIMGLQIVCRTSLRKGSTLDCALDNLQCRGKSQQIAWEGKR